MDAEDPVNLDAVTLDAVTIEDHGGWSSILNTVADGTDLSREQATAAMASVLAGEANPAQIAGLIVGLRVKGESVSEMTGLATGMLGAAEALTLPPGTVDIVGTGGSRHRRKHALNVSTMASFLAAAAGATVCKHGNYKISSTSGSFDLLALLGVRVDMGGVDLARCVEETGLGFALARRYHPALKHAGPVRAELGIPTVFNVLGPLAHPGQPQRQVLGTAEVALAERMAEVRREMGSELTWVVAGADGLDELSTTGPNSVFVSTPAGVERRMIHAPDFGLDTASPDDLAGGDAAANMAILHGIAAGEGSAARDIVVLNAAAGLVVGGVAPDLSSGVNQSMTAIEDGRLGAKIAEVAAWTPEG